MSDWKKQVADFKGSLKVEPPAISMLAMRISLFGGVGSGKSVTGGKVAVGMLAALGMKGAIGWVDGESHRSGLASDIVAEMASKHYGGTKLEWLARFKVVHVAPPYHPLRVVAAMELLEEQGCSVIILDIMSQCWDSDGGYLDMKAEVVDRMAGDDVAKQQRVASAAAARVKPQTHFKLVNKVNSSKAHLVLLFQAKQKFNPATSKPDAYETPIQESGLTRTAIACGRVESNEQGIGGHCYFEGNSREGTKFTHPSVLTHLPENGKQMDFTHAENLMRWMMGSSKQPPVTQPTSKVVSKLDALKKELWTLTKSKHGDVKAELQQWLIDEAIIADTQTLDELTESDLVMVIEQARKKVAR